MTRHRDRGFTLVEILLALSIGAALLVILFGGVRAGLAAWGRGEARAMALEHSRSLAQVLGRAVAGTYPYRGTLTEGIPEGVIFDGRPDRLTFVTVSPSIAPPILIAFTAVMLSRDDQGLAVRQLVLPNRERLERLAPVLVDSTVTEVRFRYLGRGDEAWKDQWDMSKEDDLPRAVEIQLSTAVGSRGVERQPALVVPVRVLVP
jgi:general secretion pathway protein J